MEEMAEDSEGAAATAVYEGTRPLILEVQALTSPCGAGFPRRTALGIDHNRLNMILAVLEANSQFKYLLIAMESTSFYGVHVANYLSTSDRLKPYGVKVFCLNPKEVANYKKSFTGLGKNDGLDSFIVADYIRVGRIAIEPWRGAQYLALQRLTRQRRHVTEAITREKNYVLNNVFLKFSEFALLDGEQSPLKNKFGATAEAILTEYKTIEDLNLGMKKLYETEIVPLMKKEGLSTTVYTQLTDVEQEINGLVTYDRKITKIDPELMRSLNAMLKF